MSRVPGVGLEALRVRLAIESIASLLWAEAVAVDVSEVKAVHVKSRLVLAIAKSEPHRRFVTLGAVLLVQKAYSETSDVIHGRICAKWIGAQRVAEWDSDIEGLRVLLGNETECS